MGTQLDRRQVLLGLAGVCAASAVLVGITEEASAAELDQAWDKLNLEPWFFEVGEGGTLVEPGGSEPKTRADVFFTVDDTPRTVADLIEQLEFCQPLAWHFQSLAEEKLETISEVIEDEDNGLSKAELRRLKKLMAEMEAVSDEQWRPWIRHEGKAGLPQFHKIIGDWLAAPINWSEEDYFASGWHGQGRAMAFFEELDADVRGALGVWIVEGEFPGSTYYAAELHKPTYDANEVADRLGLPFRFKRI